MGVASWLIYVLCFGVVCPVAVDNRYKALARLMIIAISSSSSDLEEGGIPIKLFLLALHFQQFVLMNYVRMCLACFTLCLQEGFSGKRC